MSGIDEILKRKAGEGPKRIRIVGQRDGDWIAHSLDGFSAPFQISANDLRTNYGGDGNPPPSIDEAHYWSQVKPDELARRNRDAQQAAANAPTPLSPEQAFRTPNTPKPPKPPKVVSTAEAEAAEARAADREVRALEREDARG